MPRRRQPSGGERQATSADQSNRATGGALAPSVALLLSGSAAAHFPAASASPSLMGPPLAEDKAPGWSRHAGQVPEAGVAGACTARYWYTSLPCFLFSCGSLPVPCLHKHCLASIRRTHEPNGLFVTPECEAFWPSRSGLAALPATSISVREFEGESSAEHGLLPAAVRFAT